MGSGKMLHTILSYFLISTVFAMENPENVPRDLAGGGSGGNLAAFHPIQVFFLDNTRPYCIRNLHQVKVNLTDQDGKLTAGFTFRYRQNEVLKPIRPKEKDLKLVLLSLPVTATAYFISDYINIETMISDEWQPPKQIGQITIRDILRTTDDGILEILDEIYFTPKSIRFKYTDVDRVGSRVA